MKIPDALYRCRGNNCGRHPYAPADLYWWDGETRSGNPLYVEALGNLPEGWYCRHCMDFYFAVFGPPSLEAYLDAREVRDEEVLNKVLDGPEFVPTIDEGEREAWP